MKIEIPKNCPSCDSKLELINDQLFCKNAATCPAQSSLKLISFCKTLKIKGFGEKTCEKLGFSQITDLDNYSVAYAVDKGISPKVAQNLQDELDKMSNGVDFNTFLAAFSIPLIGTTASRKIAEHCNNITDISNSVMLKAGLGDKARTSLEGWLWNEWDGKYDSGLKFIKIAEKKAQTQVQSNGDVCISGKLNGLTKAQATTLLNEAGYQVKSSLTKSCVFLISEDGKESSKVKKAKSQNTKIVTLEELINND